MRKLFIGITLLLFASVAFGDWAEDYDVGETFYGLTIFNGDATVKDTTKTDFLVADDSSRVRTKTLYADTLASTGGTVIKPNGILMGPGDSLVGTDATRADSFMFKHDGSNVDFFSDDGITFSPNGGATYFCNYLGYYPNDDTLRTSGRYDKRHKESHALRQCWSSPDKVDSGKIFDNGDSTMFQTDNARVRFNGCVLADTVRPKDLRPQMVMWDLMSGSAATWAITVTTSGVAFCSAPFATSPDSIIIDSMRMVMYSGATQDSVDSIRIFQGATRATGATTTLVWSEGNNYGLNGTGYFAYSYAGINKAVAPDWRLYITIWAKNPVTTLQLVSGKFYVHYK